MISLKSFLDEDYISVEDLKAINSDNTHNSSIFKFIKDIHFLRKSQTYPSN